MYIYINVINKQKKLPMENVTWNNEPIVFPDMIYFNKLNIQHDYFHVVYIWFVKIIDIRNDTMI